MYTPSDSAPSSRLSPARGVRPMAGKRHRKRGCVDWCSRGYYYYLVGEMESAVARIDDGDIEALWRARGLDAVDTVQRDRNLAQHLPPSHELEDVGNTSARARRRRPAFPYLGARDLRVLEHCTPRTFVDF